MIITGSGGDGNDTTGAQLKGGWWGKRLYMRGAHIIPCLPRAGGAGQRAGAQRAGAQRAGAQRRHLALCLDDSSLHWLVYIPFIFSWYKITDIHIYRVFKCYTYS